MKDENGEYKTIPEGMVTFNGEYLSFVPQHISGTGRIFRCNSIDTYNKINSLEDFIAHQKEYETTL